MQSEQFYRKIDCRDLNGCVICSNNDEEPAFRLDIKNLWSLLEYEALYLKNSNRYLLKIPIRLKFLIFWAKSEQYICNECFEHETLSRQAKEFIECLSSGNVLPRNKNLVLRKNFPQRVVEDFLLV